MATEFMQRISLADLERASAPREVVALRAGASVGSALRLLQERGVHGAPVRPEDSDSVLGMVDVRDLATALLLELEKEKKDEISVPDWETRPEQLIARGIEFAGLRVEQCINLSGANQTATVYANGTVAQLAEEMVRSKAHRVAIVNDKDVLHR